MIDFLLIYKQTVEFIYRVYVRQVFDQWKYSFLFFSECRPGFYKWLLGNTPCYPCPANSYTNAPKSVECNCADGYFRNPRDSKNSSCTRKYNASNFLLLKRWFLTFSNLVRPPPTQHTHTLALSIIFSGYTPTCSIWSCIEYDSVLKVVH